MESRGVKGLQVLCGALIVTVSGVVLGHMARSLGVTADKDMIFAWIGIITGALGLVLGAMLLVWAATRRMKLTRWRSRYVLLAVLPLMGGLALAVSWSQPAPQAGMAAGVVLIAIPLVSLFEGQQEEQRYINYLRSRRRSLRTQSILSLVMGALFAVQAVVLGWSGDPAWAGYALPTCAMFVLFALVPRLDAQEMNRRNGKNGSLPHTATG